MLQAIEGIYKDGKVELAEIPEGISESRVIVTFLENLENKPNSQSEQIMTFGMFSGSQQSMEADFQLAEFQGDADDQLDWKSA